MGISYTDNSPSHRNRIWGFEALSALLRDRLYGTISMGANMWNYHWVSYCTTLIGSTECGACQLGRNSPRLNYLRFAVIHNGAP